VGLALTAAGWAACQAAARARAPRPWGPAILDAAIPLAFFAFALALSGRPIFAGIFSVSLIGGFAFADWGKRAVLREPVVFADMAELVEIVRHPHLYLPYVGTKRVLAGAGLAATLVVGLLVLERPWPFWRWWTPLAAIAACAALILLSAGPLLQTAVGRFRRWAWTGQPVEDSARLGPLAMQFVHGMTARAERPRRRAEMPVLTAPALLRDVPAPSVILVQSESFFDPRRLDPGLACDLAGFDRGRSEAFLTGLMHPPSWGANTVRTEFEVLTGAGRDVTGLDWFNPYHQFARSRLPSLAWALKARGYRTVCVHPFDGGFYGRRDVLPLLGFDSFLDRQAFAGEATSGRYVSDLALGRFANDLLQSNDPTFLFLITIENHGPWPDAAGGEAALSPLESYVRGVGRSDLLVREVLEGAVRRRRGDLVAFYGDHLPSLGAEFDQRAFTNLATDYFIWSQALEPGGHVDLPAHGLGERVLDALAQIVAPETV
jgi:hypothetical protein